MTQRKLKLTLWPTLFTIPALLVLVGLGTWQLQRMQWKSEIIDTFEERISDEAVAPPLKVTNIEKWRFKRVALMGKFCISMNLLTGKTFEGTRVSLGHTVKVRMVKSHLLIGLIPERLRHRKTRPETTEGSVVVEVLSGRIKKGYFVRKRAKMTFGST